MSFSQYPVQLDNSTSLPPAVDNVTPVKAEVFNRLRDAVLAVQAELGASPSSTFGTVKDFLDYLLAQLETVKTELGVNPSGSYNTVEIRLDTLEALLDALHLGAVFISDADTTQEHLEDSLLAGTNILINKLNPGANEKLEISLENITLPAGKTADFDAGTVVLPDGPDTQIQGVSLHANFTGTNINTLLNGSNADDLHTHAEQSSDGTSGEAINVGDWVSFDDSGSSAKIFKADANGAGELVEVIGISLSSVSSGASMSFLLSGKIEIPNAQWDSVPVAADVGKPVFLSTNAGKSTLTPPTGAGETQIRVGKIKVVNPSTITVIVNIGEPTVM